MGSEAYDYHRSADIFTSSVDEIMSAVQSLETMPDGQTMSRVNLMAQKGEEGYDDNAARRNLIKEVVSGELMSIAKDIYGNMDARTQNLLEQKIAAVLNSSEHTEELNNLYWFALDERREDVAAILDYWTDIVTQLFDAETRGIVGRGVPVGSREGLTLDEETRRQLGYSNARAWEALTAEGKVGYYPPQRRDRSAD